MMLPRRVFKVNDNGFSAWPWRHFGMGVNVTISMRHGGNQRGDDQAVFRFAAAAFKVNDALTWRIVEHRNRACMSFVGGAAPDQLPQNQQFGFGATLVPPTSSIPSCRRSVLVSKTMFRHGINTTMNDQLRHGLASSLASPGVQAHAGCWWRPTSSKFSSYVWNASADQSQPGCRVLAFADTRPSFHRREEGNGR